MHMAVVKDRNRLFIQGSYIFMQTEQVRRFYSLNQWFKTPQGERVGYAFVDEFMSIHSSIKGERLLQLGSCMDNPWLSHMPFPQQWIISPFQYHRSTLTASLTALPIERDSIDCIIAPLTLEAFAGDKHPLGEFDRVLKPMGHLILFGVNPWSLWGLGLHYGLIACFGGARGSLRTSLYLQHNLMARGFRPIRHSSFYYIPPVTSKKWIQNLTFFNQIGKMAPPFPAGFYCLIMQKYQISPPRVLIRSSIDHLLFQGKSSLQVTRDCF